jgi:hypothetical protein
MIPMSPSIQREWQDGTTTLDFIFLMGLYASLYASYMFGTFALF